VRAATKVRRPSQFAIFSQPGRESFVAFVVALGAALVTELWWRNAAGHLTSAGVRVTAAGRVTGLLGTYLVLVGILLMGRVPWLDNLIGVDRLAVWHRRGGEAVAILLIAHTVLTVVGYAMSLHVDLLGEVKTIVFYLPDMLMATVGLVVLLLVVVTSLRFIRTRLAYETWHFIHLYAYLAIALTFAHQLATGEDFATHPVSRVIWAGLYVVTLGLFGWYRLVHPVLSSARHRLHVEEVVTEGNGVVSVYVGGRRLHDLRADAGQFARWRFLTKDDWWHAHPFSLSAAPNGLYLRLTARGQRGQTSKLARLAPGVRVIAEGPHGAFTGHRRTRRRVLLVAGGIGITPLRALLESLPAGRGDITLLYRASDASDVVLRDEIDELAGRRGATVHYLLGPRSQRPDPLGPERLADLVPDVAERDVFVCGPDGMTRHVIASLRKAGVPRRHIHTEGFVY